MTPQPSEPRTKEGPALLASLASGEYRLTPEQEADYTNAILAIEAAAAAPDPVATGEPMPMRMRTALSAFEAWAEAVIPMLENAGDTETAAYGRDRIEQSENARTTVRRWSAPDPVASPLNGDVLAWHDRLPHQQKGCPICEHGLAVATPAPLDGDWHGDGDACTGIHCGNPEHGWDRPLDVERLARALHWARLLIRQGYRDEHIVTFNETGYGLQHPIRCRPDLLGCRFNQWLAGQTGPDREPGRYVMTWPTFPDGIPRYEPADDRLAHPTTTGEQQ